MQRKLLDAKMIANQQYKENGEISRFFIIQKLSLEREKIFKFGNVAFRRPEQHSTVALFVTKIREQLNTFF